MFDDLHYILAPTTASKKDLAFLKKMLRVFFLGQLVGLPTLKSILTRLEIKSNKSQIDFTKLCKKLSGNKIRLFFQYAYEQAVSEKLEELANKHSSNWSRVLVTAVIDDSVFRQWLQSNDALKDFENCYGSFFSGQYKTAVFGYKVVTFGLTIDGVFYPMYFECAKKTDKTKKKTIPEAISVAIRLVERWGKFRRTLETQGIKLPFIPISCDSGYSHLELAKACEATNLRYISVPKKSHLFDINGQRWKLSDYITKVVAVLETKHLEKESTPYTHRISAYYKSMGIEVVLLFVRLNGSKKISVVYTTNNTMHAKTIRHHWFQRTQIEQFFRLLKHVLKIQQATTRTKHNFEFKLFRFAFVALHAQLLIHFIRKKCKLCKQNKKIGFQVLQRQLTGEPSIINTLKKYVNLSFCKPV